MGFNYRIIVFAGLALITAPLAAWAQKRDTDWPSRVVRWVVPYAPGGPADYVSRIIATKLSTRLGVRVIIDNRGGASGNIGADFVARAAPDGYTLLYVNPFIITNPLTMRDAPAYLEALQPVIHITDVPMVLVANPGFPGETLGDVVAEMRKRPRGVTCGSSGALPQVACELLHFESKAEVTSVLYRGQAPALTAVMAGEIDMAFDMANSVAPAIESKSVRPIATTARARGDVKGNLPTMAELSPEFQLVVWQGLMAPAATPAPIVARLNMEVGAILDDPEVRRQLESTGLTVAGGTSESFGQLIREAGGFYADLFLKAKIEPK